MRCFTRMPPPPCIGINAELGCGFRAHNALWVLAVIYFYFSYYLLIKSFSEIFRPTAKFCMVIGSCCSFDPSTSDFLYPTPFKFWKAKLTKIWCVSTSSHIINLYAVLLSADKVSANKRLSVNLRCYFLPNDSNLNNFHHERFARRHLVSRDLIRVTVSQAVRMVQSGAIWRMKEPHCGFFSGRASSVATPSSYGLSLCDDASSKRTA